MIHSIFSEAGRQISGIMETESLGMMNFDISEELTKQLYLKMNEKKYKKYITDSNDKFWAQMWFYRENFLDK